MGTSTINPIGEDEYFEEYTVVATAAISHPMTYRYYGPLQFALSEEKLLENPKSAKVLAMHFDVEDSKSEEVESCTIKGPILTNNVLLIQNEGMEMSFADSLASYNDNYWDFKDDNGSKTKHLQIVNTFEEDFKSVPTTTINPTTSVENSIPVTTDNKNVQNISNTKTLPQTGMNILPIPILSLSGLFLLGIGWNLVRKSR